MHLEVVLAGTAVYRISSLLLYHGVSTSVCHYPDLRHSNIRGSEKAEFFIQNGSIPSDGKYETWTDIVFVGE